MTRIPSHLTFLLLACLVGVVDAQEQILPNGQFTDGLEHWVFRPGSEKQVSLVDGTDRQGNVLELHPDGELLGVETERLTIGKELAADQAYEVFAQLKYDGLESGVFAFSMYCFDERGRSLKQIAFYHLNARSRPHDWRTVRGTFGPGTQNPLPEGTRSICIRFSFYHSDGDCRGKVSIDDVRLLRYEPATHEGWPHEIIADVGELQIRFESRSFWTLYRIDYRGTRLGLDRWGSHYGSVASFPGVGFIGSGHTENEDEQILDLKLFVDGKPVEKPAQRVTCGEIQLLKKSRIRDLILSTDIRVCSDRIHEEVRLVAEKATPVTLVYHFMHPWTVTATEYAAELLDGTHVEGLFDGDGTQKIDRATRWSAIYDGPSGKGAVTYVVDVPKDSPWRTRYWDVPDRYRKHYFVTFEGQTIPANQEFQYRIVTVPFEAELERWKGEAMRIAEECGPSTPRHPRE